MNKNTIAFAFIFCFMLIIFSCEKMMPPAPTADEVMDASVDGLSQQQNKLFLEGAEEFDEIYTAETGLGPILLQLLVVVVIQATIKDILLQHLLVLVKAIL